MARPFLSRGVAPKRWYRQQGAGCHIPELRVLHVHWYQKSKAHSFLVTLMAGKLIPVMRILL